MLTRLGEPQRIIETTATRYRIRYIGTGVARK